MQIAGIGYCAIRGCDRRAAELTAGIALCRPHCETLSSALKTPPKLFREVVYYATWTGENSIKIGTSSAIVPRLRALSTGHKGRARVLAAEPGSFSIERKRHREFRVARKPGTELFRATPQIMNHISRIRADWPTWAELAGIGTEWL
jgi:hypothetical protein